MSDIFISYASENRERAKQLAAVLTQQGWSVWWDRKIPPGKTWAEVIEQQLDAAKCVIVLWSRDSVASEWVKNEAREGKARGILIPILIEEAKIPLEFRHIHYANLMGWDPEAPRPDLDELLLELEQLLGKPKQRQQGLVPPERAPEAVEALRQRLHALEKQAAPLRSWMPDAWARAEQCGQEAEVAWQEQRYPDATRLFELALRAYAEAHSAAQDAQTQQQAHEAKAQAEQAEQDARSMIERERAKQEAEAKQSQVAIIRERASEAEVEKYASGAFREAVHTERRGDTALSQGEYTQARELYLTAQQRYAQAQQQAEMQRQRAREAVEALRQRLHALGKQAAPLRSWVPDAWARAEQCGQEAEVAWQEQRYPDATRLFGLALRAYAEAHSAAQDAQTQQQAHEAQARAEQAEQDARSIEGSVQGLAEADKTMVAGKQAKSVQHWGDAVTAFTAAKEQYARIVFCYAEETRKSMEKALASAEHQGVSAAADALWPRARALVSEAEDLWNGQQAFLKAGHTYSEAARLLDDITSEIERERAKQEAEAKQSQVAIIRERASEAEVEKYASGAFREAVHTEQHGDTALSQGEYTQARELYLTAQQQYAQAQQQAQVERQRREALSVQEQAQQAEQRAIAVGAGELELSRQGQAAREQGDTFLARGAFGQAAAAHTQACRLYERAAEMQRQRAREAAEAARERALIAQAEAQEGAAAEIFADQWAQAQTLLHEAETALSQDHDDTARAGFEKCVALFRQLGEEAIVHEAREGAAQARAHALRLQRDIGAAGGWGIARAKGALARGHRLFEAANYAEARASFEKATSRFEAKLQAAARRRHEPRFAVPWAKVLPFLGLGALAAGVAFYLMRAEREPLPIEPPARRLAVPEAAAPPGVERTPPAPEPLRLTPSPDAGAPIALAEGASQTFAIDVQGAVSRPLRYTWFLDDALQGTGRQVEGPTWSYTPDFDAAGEPLKEIKVVARDAKAGQAEIRWRVKVLDTNRPPHLRVTMPTTQTLTVKSGETVRFSVKGDDPDSDDALAYVWSLDGARMAEGERFDLKSSTPGARQRVEVAVVDRAGLSERRSWEVSVEVPPLPPLAIRAANPKLAPGQELVLTERQSHTFSIEVAGGDPAALEYVWQLDGKKQATGNRWTYKAPASASRTKELRVVVSGGEGRPVEHLWRIRVNPANRPPAIVSFTPTDTRIAVARGTAHRFTVEATDADAGDPLAYSWLLDGRQLAKGTAWEMDGKVAPGQHRVEVKVSDRSGAATRQRWAVAVAEPASPPSITGAQPALNRIYGIVTAPNPPSITEVQPATERITAQTDGALDFSAVASLAGDARNGAVTYEWRIDTGPSRSTTTGQFRLPPLPAGTHKLAVVAVSPDGLKSAPRDWTIEIKPKATKTALAESEVRDWLALYRRAWESKNVELLVQLGEATRDRAAQLREILAGYDDLRVALKDLTIRIDADSARVTFRREDTIDGKTLSQPGLKELWLDKQASGRLTRRR